MTVNPDHFVSAMRKHWSKEYDLKSGALLESGWREMAIAFNNCIEGVVYHDDTAKWVYKQEEGKKSYDDRKESQWTIFRMPTGTGKTEGLCIYCALLSKQKKHPGALIVTKFTKEIDRIIKSINQHPLKATAIGDYADKKPQRASSNEINTSPVLVITHSAYQLAIEDQTQEDCKNLLWSKFTEWEGGTRRLVIIDESIDIVESVRLDVNILKIVRGWFPRQMEKTHPKKIKTFDQIIKTFLSLEEKYTEDYKSEELLPEFWKNIDQENLNWIKNELIKLPLSRIILGRENNKLINYRCKKVFNDIFTIINSRSWCEIRNGLPTIQTAYVGLPTHIKNAVVLDATAGQNMVYHLLGSLSYFSSLNDGMRSYKNVELNIVLKCPASESALLKQEEKFFLDSISSLVPKIDDGKKFLLITFNSIEKSKLALLRRRYKKCIIAHWGDINGKNDWHDIDTIVIYGLPRLSTVSIKSAMLAFQNWHDKTKIHAVPLGHLELNEENYYQLHDYDNDISEEDYQIGHITSNVIQAINRICCRKSIDEQGNCPPAKVFLMLKSGIENIEKGLLEGIRKEMKGIVEKTTTQNLKKYKSIPKRGKKIIEWFTDKPEGTYQVSTILKETGIPEGTMEKYIVRYKNNSDPFSVSMKAIGVKRYIGGKGRAGHFVLCRSKR